MNVGGGYQLKLTVWKGSLGINIYERLQSLKERIFPKRGGKKQTNQDVNISGSDLTNSSDRQSMHS
jgi:hypothetical protein